MSPDTVTEAVAFLASEGYVDDYRLRPDGIVGGDAGAAHPLATAVVDYTFRFEGDSDPGDEAIVLGVHCTDWDRKGVIVSAYGPDADPEQTALLVALAGSTSWTRPGGPGSSSGGPPAGLSKGPSGAGTTCGAPTRPPGAGRRSAHAVRVGPNSSGCWASSCRAAVGGWREVGGIDSVTAKRGAGFDCFRGSRNSLLHPLITRL